jgi:hypothetical protein
MQDKIQYYMDKALNKSTLRMYSSAWNIFKRFTLMHGVPDILQCQDRVREQCFMCFVIFCKEQLKINYSSIKSYLCAIKYFFSRSSQIHDPFMYHHGTPFTRLDLVLRGIRKSGTTSQLQREPITVPILSAMIHSLKAGLLGNYLDVMFQAVFLIAFHGFFRCGELTSHNRTFNYTRGLALADVTLHGSSSSQELHIKLRYSKTDPYGEGVVVKLFPLDNSMCPIQAVGNYIPLRKALCNNPKDSFFMMPSQLPLTRAEFITHLQQVLYSIGQGGAHIKPHSFRIGAATAAAAAKLPDHLIKTMGRWSSDSYRRYIRTPTSLLASAQRAISQV